MRITETQLRRIIQKTITEYGASSNYTARRAWMDRDYGRGHGNYGGAGYDEEGDEQKESKKEQLAQLHSTLREMYAKNPDKGVMSVVRAMMDQWDRSFEQEIIDYWTMLQR